MTTKQAKEDNALRRKCFKRFLDIFRVTTSLCEFIFCQCRFPGDRAPQLREYGGGGARWSASSQGLNTLPLLCTVYVTTSHGVWLELISTMTNCQNEEI